MYSPKACAAFLCAWMLIGPTSSNLQAQPVKMPQIKRDAIQQLDLYDGEVVTIDLQQGGVASGRVRVSVLYQSKQYTLDLQPHSIRSKDYKLIVQQADGSYQELTPGPEKSMRGRVLEIEGSVVAASISNGKLTARIILPDQIELWIEPLVDKVAGAKANQHIVYRGEDVIPSGGGCELLNPPVDADADAPLSSTGATAGTECTALFITELAIDADSEYYIEEESSVFQVEEQVTKIIDTMNLQYERDVCIRHIITAIIVRTPETDPYIFDPPHTFANTVLNDLRLQWRDNHTNIVRDVVQLFTGKTITDSNGIPGVIGVAWLGGFPRLDTICGDWGYSVVESNCGFNCLNFLTKTDLSAHELGHNWGADHCGDEVFPPDDCSPSCFGWTMNCSITSGNRFHPDITIPDIDLFRDTRRCLDEGDDLQRVIATATTNEVNEGDSLQLTAIADFKFGTDQDVTDQATWNVEPPEAGTVDANGLFTANDVNLTICITITADFTFDGLTRTGFIFISITDFDSPMAIISGNPPHDVIDARMPTDLDGSNPIGFQVFEITLNGDICSVVASDFSVMVQGGSNPAPAIIALQEVDAKTVRLFLTDPVEPGTWTSIIHDPSGSELRVGYLPGDVNGDGVSNAQDIQALMDILNGIVEPGPLWPRDIDRSGRSFPPDLIMLINVLNGADAFDPWLGATLP